MTCPNCGTKTAPSLHCRNCGKRLEAYAKECREFDKRIAKEHEKRIQEELTKHQTTSTNPDTLIGNPITYESIVDSFKELPRYSPRTTSAYDFLWGALRHIGVGPENIDTRTILPPLPSGDSIVPEETVRAYWDNELASDLSEAFAAGIKEAENRGWRK